MNCFNENDCLGNPCTRTCDSVNEGIQCATDAQCGAVTCGRKAQFCAWGSDVGNVCQRTAENCSFFGNCCNDPAACVEDSVVVLGKSAGHFRESNISPDINTTSTDTVHRFTGCIDYQGWADIGRVCQQMPWSLSGTFGSTAEGKFGVFVHEVAHSLGAHHDNSCSFNGFRIRGNACANDGGPKAGKVCDNADDCEDPANPSVTHLCNVPNLRRCVGGPKDLLYCADAALDCAGYPCGGPKNRLCIGGGTKHGKYCNEDYSMCGTGTCTGAPMTIDIYPMSGSGTWGGFSPCSQKEIGNYLDSHAGCLLPLPCGDPNRDGSITSSDGQLALRIAVGLEPYDDLANVTPIGAPDNVVNTADANYISNLAVGNGTDPVLCGRPAHPYRWINEY